MRSEFIFIILLFFATTSEAQLIKRKITVKPTHLDSLLISEHFSQEWMDDVYKTLHKSYGLNIIYDTPYCKRIVFSEWFIHTPARLAIDMTTRHNNLTYSIDSNDIIHVKRKIGITEVDGKVVSTIKYAGPPEKKNFTISGKISDYMNGEALPGASITILGNNNGTVTNADGLFTLLNVPTDTVTLVINYIGYKTAEYYLNPQIDKNNVLIEIIPADHVLDETIVTANRQDLMKMSNDNLSVIKMSPAKLAELPNVGEKDVMRAFQLMPGVSAANESSSGLYVRGGTPDQNLVLYDGFTVYQVDHLYGFFSAFNSNAVKDVQLYKGGFGAKYGGRLSSVLDITGKEGNQKNYNAGGEISLLSGNVFAEVPITDNLTFLGAARKSWQGPIYNLIFNSFNKSSSSSSSSSSTPSGAPGGTETKAKSYFYDINTKLTYKPGKRDIISFSFFNGTDNLDNGFSISTPSFLASQGIDLNIGSTDVTKYGNTGTSIKWSRKWGDKFYSNTLISYSNYFSRRDKSTNGTITLSGGDETNFKSGILENNNLKDYSYKTDYEWSIFKGNQLSFGTFATNFDIKYTYSQNDTSTILDRKNKGTLQGGYLEDKIKLFHHRVDIVPGIRASLYNVTKKVYYEPRLAAGYNITDKLSLKGSYGQYYQFANRITREDILSGSKDFWILSDGKNVPVSKATHYIAGLSYESRKYLFSIEGYYKILDSISQYSLRFNSNAQSINYNENFYKGTGTSRGLEFLIQKKAGKFTGWVSYTLGQAKNHFNINSNDDYYADQDVTHEFKIVGIYKYKKWDFSSTWVFATGKPYTAPSGAYTVKLLDGTTQDFFTVSSKNSLRLPDYHRLDVSVNYHFFNEQKQDIGYIGFSLFNLYGRKNVWYKQYTIVSNQVVETNVDYLGIVPNLTLSLKFR